MVECEYISRWVVGFRFTPESIRWYLTHNKIGKAEESLRQIAKANKKDYLEGSLKIPTVPKKNLSCLALFSSWSVTINVLIQGFVWFVIGMGYFGASYGASDLGGSMYLNFVVISLVEFPANALAIDNLERYGRKKSTIVTMIIGGICCFIVSLIPSGTDRTDYLVGRVIGGTLGKGFFTFAFDTVFVWSGEIFPTVVR
ncbi:Organic cation transporter [Paramuricea clavata]|uniref:Organic cation transporter n=1 Tax=Paramuricea clavata TaxID=317549 RepID=A0A6S7H2F1_PARCT|nr:Organic cation transporter [Paramuricea clavata]